jgi:hypothetical protein
MLPVERNTSKVKWRQDLGTTLALEKAQIQKAREEIEEKKKREEDYSIEKCIDIVEPWKGCLMKKRPMQMKFLKMNHTGKCLWVPKIQMQDDLVEEKDSSAFYTLQCYQQ